MIPKNYVQELHEVVDSRPARSREPSQSRQIPPPSSSHPPPPTTNGGAHAPDGHLAQVCLKFTLDFLKKSFVMQKN